MSQGVFRSVADRRSVAERGERGTLDALPYDFGLCDRISASSSAESVGRRESVVRSQRVGRSVSELLLPEWWESRMLEALILDSCNELSTTHLAESVAESQSPERD